MFLEALLMLFGLGYFCVQYVWLLHDAEGRFARLLKRQLKNMHHATQSEIDVSREMHTLYQEASRGRIFEAHSAYAQRKWKQLGDQRVLQFDCVAFVITAQ